MEVMAEIIYTDSAAQWIQFLAESIKGSVGHIIEWRLWPPMHIGKQLFCSFNCIAVDE